MIPAPRRCLACAQLGFQCDGRFPCTRCRDLRLPCRPAKRALEDRDAPSLVHRSRSVRTSSSASTSSSPGQEVVPISRSSRSDARYSPLRMPIDEHVSPSLAAKAASAQQLQLFVNFVLSAFPCYFKCTERRVSVNWVEYVKSRPDGQDRPFDWAIRSLTTIYTGSLYNDQRYLDAGRELYVRALRSMSGVISDVATAKSDEALATAITLAVYEMHSCTTTDGWLHHASGLRALMRLRGASAHLHGFGRATYIASRNILVTSALVAGEPCFFEEPEWQQLNEQIAADNAKQPDSSVYTDIAERAFREVVKLPGYVRRARDLSELGPSMQKRERQALLRDVLATRASLRGIHTEFGVSVSTLRAGHEPQERFIGPIPQHFFDGFTSLSIKGIRSGILLLNYLLILLDPSQRASAEAENRVITDCMRSAEESLSRSISPHIPTPTPLTPSHTPDQPRLLIESRVTPETREPPTTDWMDRIAATMGMDGVRVKLVGDV